QISKSANQQISKSANQQISKSANQQISKSATVTKKKESYPSHYYNNRSLQIQSSQKEQSRIEQKRLS
ncbi:hypothetical protein ACW5WQ_21550, partial [Aeromonas rivuli]